MRYALNNLAILASSLLVHEVFAAPAVERAIYYDTDIIMVTEEITVTELADGSYATGAPVAVGTGTMGGTQVLFTESATPVATPTSAKAAPATTSSAFSSAVSVQSSSEALFIQQTPTSSAAPKPTTSSALAVVEAPKSTSTTPVVAPTTLSTKASSTTPKAATTTSSAATVATSATSSSSKKRGLAYNDASLLTNFVSSSSSKVSWAYNWGSTTSSIASGLEYIPMLWGLGSVDTTTWSTVATAAIASGSTALLGFNEPDYSGQANLGYAAAAAGWKTYMEPFAGKAALVSPAVTNGGSPMGLTWLGNFITACSSCTIDAVAIHWYNGGDAAAFKTYVQNAYTAGGKRPLWITEFQASGTTDEQNSFLQEVIPFLDSSDMVAKYAYFMASDGILLESGTTLSTLGNTFATFV